MALKVIGESAATKLLGDVWVFTLQVTDALGYLVNTEPTVTVTFPTSGDTPATVQKVSLGHFRASVSLDEPGRYVVVATADGSGSTALVAIVAETTANAAMPTVDDCKAYADLSAWTDEQIQEALDIETIDQFSRCKVPAGYPLPLRQALMRRVQVNLAWRDVVLTTNIADPEAGTTLQPVWKDVVISQKEAPYRRVFFA